MNYLVATISLLHIVKFIFIYYFNYTFFKDEKLHSDATVSVAELWPLEICTLQQKLVLVCSPSVVLLRQSHGDGVATARISSWVKVIDGEE
jgi:hypothetical protein